ncbi:COX assembly mitochondrial protein homolog isoform X1 [Alligator mississippiensis]|uniref:COX assembly mitochondrial protein homolog isoform X1 n=1 Tax=Alligator mississippiensis TaxID=8496 RepID=UPI000907451F|nr:COX assembly mitochondrial protein homolog isoform X1 [Alligator mississippiensis]
MCRQCGGGSCGSAEWQMERPASAAGEPKLRHVEKDVLIPKMMREKARELCSDKVQDVRWEAVFPDLTGVGNLVLYSDFTKCCQETGFLMVIKCQQENAALKECLTAYYSDPAFYEECKMEYLKQREEYRKTGIPAKRKQQKLPTSM